MGGGFSDSRRDLGAINKKAPRVHAVHMGSWGDGPLGSTKAEKESVLLLLVSDACVLSARTLSKTAPPPVLQFSAMLFAEFKVPHVIDTRGDGFAAAVSTLQMNPGNSNPVCCQETQHGVQPVLHLGIVFHSPYTLSCQS